VRIDRVRRRQNSAWGECLKGGTLRVERSFLPGGELQFEAELSLPEPSPFGTWSLEKEWAFLCDCVSPHADPACIASPASGELNWAAVLELGQEHGVQGMLAKRLEDESYAGVPTAVREKLRGRMRAQQIFTLSLTAELFRVLDDFAVAHLDVIPVKGPVISQIAYGDPAMRSFGDLDLLLRQQDMPAAIERMQACGFTPDFPVETVRNGKIPGEYRFRKSDSGLLVELHTEKTFRHYPLPMRIDEMIARRRIVLLDGRGVPALSVEDEIVFDCVHGGKDFWERLMWVSDVAAIATGCAQMDWEKALRFAHVVEAEGMLHTGLRLAADVFALKLPTGIADAVQLDAASAALSGRIREWLPYAGYKPIGAVRRALYRMQIAGGGLSGAGYLLRLSLSPAEEDWDHAATDRKSWLWETVRRPIRLMRKYGSQD
jgi:hypothetical protein